MPSEREIEAAAEAMMGPYWGPAENYAREGVKQIAQAALLAAEKVREEERHEQFHTALREPHLIEEIEQSRNRTPKYTMMMSACIYAIW